MKNLARQLLFALLLLAPAARAQDSLSPPPAALRKIPPAELAALNARVDALEKIETIGSVIFWAGQLKWFIFANIKTPAAAFGDLALLGVSETGLAMDFYANTHYRRMYKDIGGEEAFLSGSGTGWYIFSKTLMVSGVGLLTLGLINKEEGPVYLGGAAIIFNDFINILLWRNLHSTNRSLAEGIRNWNLGAGLDTRGSPQLSLNYRF
jgi:hypothetical protein